MARLIVQPVRLMPAIVLGEEKALADAGTEQYLIARATAGDNDAFDALIALHEPRVRRLAHRLLGWRDAGGELDDVVQDVFVRLLEKCGTFRGDASLATWLTTVTVNRCRAMQRRRWVRLKWLRAQRSDAGASNEPRGVERDEPALRVREAVQSLKPKDREVIVLFYLEERTVAEISRLLGVSPNAIEVRLHRSRAKLKRLLSEWRDE